MRLAKHYSTIASTLALVIALTGVGAYAAGKIGSKQIRRGGVKTKNLHTGAVTPAKTTFPAAASVKRTFSAHTSANVGAEYAQIADMGSYSKQDASSILQVTWTGTASTGFDPCVFQIRVDGQPPQGGGAELFVANGTSVSVSAQGLFAGISAGSHAIEIYAHARDAGSFPCSVGGTNPNVTQTVNVAELVQ